MTEAMNAAISVGLEPLVERKAGSAADYHSEFTAQGFAANDFAEDLYFGRESLSRQASCRNSFGGHRRLR